MGAAHRTASKGARRSRLLTAAVVAALLIVAACESATVDRINQTRAASSLGSLPVSAVATEAARANSVAMCAAGATTPSADPGEDYDQETAAAVGELVGSAPLDPAITDPGQRNGAAANQIWAAWQGDPQVVDARWNDVAVGEHECAADGRLYSTAVFRDAPTMPASGMYSSTQYTLAQVQTFSGLQYRTAVNYQGTTVPLLLDVYVPPSIGSPRPVVILVHGGGFINGSRADMAAGAREYARRGYVAVSIDYRLDPRLASNPGLLLAVAANAIDDGIESVRWLRANAATYGIDENRIGVVGSSAGGAIALGMAITEDLSPGGPLGSFSPDISAAVSTGAHLTPGVEAGVIGFEADDAPVMMFHYETDSVTDNTDDYAFVTCAEVRASGNTCDFNVQAGSGHTVSINAGGSNWTSEIGPFLWQHLDL